MKPLLLVLLVLAVVRTNTNASMSENIVTICEINLRCKKEHDVEKTLIILCITSHADDTGMFYGMKFYNDLLMEAGPTGNVQSEVLLQKDKDTS
ncbi:hypothetical protein RND71_014527 [Anisodus tanguticus]|uniref:Uncharacterized protein n=1 Tax=Anisodus tanguticus TaxID=243964 RepID=A0AAE1SBY3_9SOLA|nr:hypothetical protein RND71_014527 [Anisodus tanguticus]